jgi:hypothetical protein
MAFMGSSGITINPSRYINCYHPTRCTSGLHRSHDLDHLFNRAPRSLTLSRTEKRIEHEVTSHNELS